MRTRVPPGAEGALWEFGREIIPDIWLTLVALNGSLRALALAAKVSPTKARAIRTLRKDLALLSSIKNARDVHEHLDDYFQGKGTLQKREGERPDMHLPQVGVESDVTTLEIKRIEVRIGGSPRVDVLAAIEQACRALSKALELLRAEDR
jgi:hypothetical protein